MSTDGIILKEWTDGKIGWKIVAKTFWDLNATMIKLCRCETKNYNWTDCIHEKTEFFLEFIWLMDREIPISYYYSIKNDLKPSKYEKLIRNACRKLKRIADKRTRYEMKQEARIFRGECRKRKDALDKTNILLEMEKVRK